MKPGFALSLSFEGITLLSRSASGWHQIGDIRLDVPELDAAIADLRRNAAHLAPSGIRSKIVLPDDQIRYLSVETGKISHKERLEWARAALDGTTPYDLDDLVIDISADGPVTHVAAVARETLNEAEAFAVQHEFHPVSFVAAPRDRGFQGEPFFGETAYAGGILPKGQRVERDPTTIHQKPIRRAPNNHAPVNHAAAPPSPSPSSDAGAGETLLGLSDRLKAATTPHPQTVQGKAAAGTQPLAGGFSSRRKRRRPGTADWEASPDSVDTLQDAAPALDPLPPRPARPAPTVAVTEAQTVSIDVPTGRATPSPDRPAMATPGDAARRAAMDVTAAPTQDEAARMTVFGARDAAAARSRPRFMGVILTVVLLIVMAAVAAWASGFGNDAFARLFRSPGPSVAATAPVTAMPGPEILDMPARVVAQPDSAPERMAQTNRDADAVPDSRPDPVAGRSPLPQGADANVVAPSAPDLTTIQPPAPGSRADGRLALALRPETLTAPEARDTGNGAPTLPQVGGPADPPARDPEPHPDPAADPPVAGRDTGSATRYAATGIWSTAPTQSETPGLITLDDLYLAAIDRATLTPDAVALPGLASYGTDIPLNGVASPAPAGNTFELDALGLVEPSPEGTLTPDGFRVYQGKPPKVPPPTPRRVDTVRDPVPAAPVLPKKRPRARPDNLAETVERRQFGGLSEDELRRIRPRSRPFAPVAETAPVDSLAEAIAADVDVSPAQARLATIRPKGRPQDFAALAARAQTPAARPADPPVASAASAGTAGPAAQASTADLSGLNPAAPSGLGRAAPAVPRSQTAKPTGKTPSSVAKLATVENAINLHRVNLIGVYGTPSNRRALVRLSNGRYKKVKVGDSIEGGRIVAIGDSELRYQKGGRNVVLRMPKG
ncbi:MAG: hypothetical protein ACWA5A_14015 [Marinibacterium sp.]